MAAIVNDISMIKNVLIITIIIPSTIIIVL